MEYKIKYYYRVKYALVCARQSFLKDPPKDEFEEYAKKVLALAERKFALRQAKSRQSRGEAN